ncbi:FAD-binding domain-containing protein [Marasmius fiardii PR-910]|nr:FAD-binding domain-containing protein [Marasmius fiardii PR-910]
MFLRRLLLLLACSVFRVGVTAQDSPTGDSSLGSDCSYTLDSSYLVKCNALYSELPSLVFARDTAEYNDRHTTYYSLQQQELFPNCTVKPSSPSDISRVLQIAQTRSCPFAVASGGHMSWKGSSNLDGGFVIDLRGMNQIDISPQDQTVKLGPGSPWTNVYAAMASFNVTTTGARINSVGVGGFLLGGS